jgi:hypothetical protein
LGSSSKNQQSARKSIVTDQDEKNLEERSDIKSDPVDEYVDDFTESQ